MTSTSSHPQPSGSLLLRPATTNECKNCIYCGTHTVKLDARCGSVYYCSGDCQKADWPSHKLVCKAYAEQKGSQRPSPSHKRAIYFPADQTSPSLLWIQCNNSDGSNSKEVLSLLGEDNPIPTSQLIQRSPRLERRALQGTLEVVYREDHMLDSTKRSNKSIDRALGPDIYRPQEWRGPVVLLRKQGFGMDPDTYVDTDLADYRHALDFFATSGYSLPEYRREKPKRDRVMAVKINCVGEKMRNGLGFFTAVEVPSQSLEQFGYTVGKIIPISKLINLPIRAWKCPTSERPAEGRSYSTQNIPATIINISPDINSNGFGWSPHYWQSDVGNVLLVREDGEDLNVNLAESFCRWIEYNLWPKFEDALGLFASTPSQHASKRQGVLQQITRENMDAYGLKLPEEDRLNANINIERLVAEDEFDGDQGEQRVNIDEIAKQLRQANKADREYGQSIIDLVDEDQDEYDLSYLSPQKS